MTQQLATSHATPVAAPTAATRQEGVWQRGKRWLIGERVKGLTEQHRPTSFMAYVLMGAQGAALVLVFGHTEIQWLEQRNVILLAIMAMSLFVLVATAIAAQNCAIACMQRVGVLWRNGAYGMMSEHVAYITFVVLLEILTFALAIYVLETNPHALLTDEPIIPFGAAGLVATIVLRAAYIGWTEIQLQIVRSPLPLQWETFLEESKSMIGGHGQAILQGMELTNTDLAAVALAYAETVKPPVRRKTWWNGALIRRDEEYKAALDEQSRRIAAQLQAMGGNRIADLEHQLRDVQIHASDQAIDMTARALTALVTGGHLPDWFTEARPELADITLTKRAVSRGKGAGNTAAKATESPADARRFFLASLDISPAKAPDKSRRIWVKSSDIVTLSAGLISREEATRLAERLGKDASKDGVSPRDGLPYIAPLDTVMRELSERHKLSETVTNAWAVVTQSGSDSDEKGNMIELQSRREARA